MRFEILKIVENRKRFYTTKLKVLLQKILGQPFYSLSFVCRFKCFELLFYLIFFIIFFIIIQVFKGCMNSFKCLSVCLFYSTKSHFLFLVNPPCEELTIGHCAGGVLLVRQVWFFGCAELLDIF